MLYVCTFIPDSWPLLQRMAVKFRTLNPWYVLVHCVQFDHWHFRDSVHKPGAVILIQYSIMCVIQVMMIYSVCWSLTTTLLVSTDTILIILLQNYRPWPFWPSRGQLCPKWSRPQSKGQNQFICISFLRFLCDLASVTTLTPICPRNCKIVQIEALFQAKILG
jgi:hypothetical protein